MLRSRGSTRRDAARRDYRYLDRARGERLLPLLLELDPAQLPAEPGLDRQRRALLLHLLPDRRDLVPRLAPPYHPLHRRRGHLLLLLPRDELGQRAPRVPAVPPLRSGGGGGGGVGVGCWAVWVWV
jgi:hypothetical protein